MVSSEGASWRHDGSLAEFLGSELNEPVVNDRPFFSEHTINDPRAASKDFPEYEAVAGNPKPAVSFKLSLQAFDIAVIAGPRFDGPSEPSARLKREGFNEGNDVSAGPEAPALRQARCLTLRECGA